MMSNTNYVSMGGEQELSSHDLFYGVTNSGRSSLRWILESMDLRGKRVLVPDFLCQIVLDVLNEYDIEPIFYNVGSDFSYEINNSEALCDALYVIRYFGEDPEILKAPLTMPTIIDDVFGTEAPTLSGTQPWCYFNSLRKISAVADYSQVVSTLPLSDVDKVELTNFTEAKYAAKNAKYNYINNGLGEEGDYLDLFADGESVLNGAELIYQPSDIGLYHASNFYRTIEAETQVRRHNLSLAKQLLKPSQYVDISPKFPSFLPLILGNRDKVRRALMSEGIFLAVHWPETDQVQNPLSRNILSIPLDSRYHQRDIERVCHLIQELVDE